jgi:hypothetical protein
MKQLPPFRPPWVAADDLNVIREEVLRRSTFDVEGGDFEETPGGRVLRIPSVEVPIPARVVEAGDTTDADTVPHSWVQQRPRQDGTWEDDPNGINGNAPGTADFATDGAMAGPLFSPDGGGMEPDTVAYIRKGYVGLVGGAVRQEWEVIGAAGGATRLSLVRTTGRPWCLPGLPRIYPAAFRLNNAADLGYHAGDAIWLVQADDDPLDTRGAVTYAATLKHRDYTVETDAGPVTHDLYVTTGRISLADVECNPDGTLTRTFTGEFEGCQNDDAMAFEGEMVLFAGEGAEFD